MRVAEIACLGCDDGIALVFGESLTIIGTISHTLCLTWSGRGIESHDGPCAKPSCIILVHYSRSAEDRTQPISLKSCRHRCPVYQVTTYGMSPCHILPLRSIGIPLIVEMPFAIFVKHSIGVIHPSIGGCMMIKRSVHFLITHIQRINITHPFPTSKLSNCCRMAWIPIKGDIKQSPLSYLIGHKIIHLSCRQAAVEGCYQPVVAHHTHMGHLFTFVNRQQQIFSCRIESHHGMALSQHFNLLRITLQRGSYEGCHCSNLHTSQKLNQHI